MFLTRHCEDYAQLYKTVCIIKKHARFHEMSETGLDNWIGSTNPYKGGNGTNYWIDKLTGRVTIVSTEDIEPIPGD